MLILVITKFVTLRKAIPVSKSYAPLTLAAHCMTASVSDLIKTHGSELRGQEVAGLCDEPVSYL